MTGNKLLIKGMLTSVRFQSIIVDCSAVEILKTFVRHLSDRILDFVGPNKILSDQTFLYSLLANYVELFRCYFH